MSIFAFTTSVLQIVHQDLKSKNVLLAKGQTAAKLADVGLSRVLNSLSFSSASSTYGTFAYAAPELLLSYTCTEKVMPQLLTERVAHACMFCNRHNVQV